MLTANIARVSISLENEFDEVRQELRDKTAISRDLPLLRR
jgi:hypothetical protein